MAGRLESAMVEIRLTYDSFLSLQELNPDLPPDCVIECLEKFFGDRHGNRSHRSIFTSKTTSDHIKITMKNLETAYKAYQNLSRTTPKSAPTALIKTVNAILTPSSLVRAKTEMEPIVPYLKASMSKSTSFAQEGSVLRKEPTRARARDLHPQESFRQATPAAKKEVGGPWKVYTHNQNTYVMAVASQKDTTDDDGDVENNLHVELETTESDDIASNGASSLSSASDFSHQSNQYEEQNENENDSEIQAPPGNSSKIVHECIYGCGKMYGTEWHRLNHEKIHSGIGLINCKSCDREFSSRANYVSHEKACRNPKQTSRVKKGRKKRFLAHPMRCDFCYRKFTNLEVFERHRATFPEERLKNCRDPTCTRRFCYESHRDHHESRHSKLRKSQGFLVL